MRRVGTVLALVAVIGTACSAANAPTGQQVVAAFKRQFDKVNDYRADVVLSIKNSSVSLNSMKMVVYYKKPNKIRFEAKDGFAVVPQGTFMFNPAEEMLKHSKPVYLKSEKRSGRDCHLIRLDPVEKGDPVTKMWIDTQHSVIVSTDTAAPRQMTTDWKHSLVDGKYHMPSQIMIRTVLPGEKDSKSVTQATVKLSNYRVNKGISDAVFAQKSKPR